MVALVKSCTLVGIDAAIVDVECEVARGLPIYKVVGLPATSVKEGAVRIRSALRSVGHDLPLKRVTVNLAPADLRKSGSALDLPIAGAVLVGDGAYDGAALDRLLVLGELGLDGTVRKVPGALAAALLAREQRLRGVIVPAACGAEAGVVDGIEVYVVEHLAEVVDALAGRRPLRPPSGAPRAAAAPRASHDMSEVRGQHLARMAIEIAVAGGHNVLLAGPPGTGDPVDIGRLRPFVPPVMPRCDCWPISMRRDPTAPRGASSSIGSSRSETARRRGSSTRTRRSCRCTSRSTRMRRFSPGAPPML